MHSLYLELHPSRNLETLKGVGPYVAAVAVAAIGNPKRFPNTRKFRAFTGMIPKVSSSGQTESKRTPLSKAGPNWLKRVLFLAADVARQWDPQLAKIYYDQVVRYGITISTPFARWRVIWQTESSSSTEMIGHTNCEIWKVTRSARPMQKPTYTPI